MRILVRALALIFALSVPMSAAARIILFTPDPETPDSWGFWGKIIYDEKKFTSVQYGQYDPLTDEERVAKFAGLIYVGFAFDRPTPTFAPASTGFGGVQSFFPNYFPNFDFSYDGNLAIEFANADGTEQFSLNGEYFRYGTDAATGTSCPGEGDSYCTGRAKVQILDIPAPGGIALFVASVLGAAAWRLRRPTRP